jgi:hypothetical protein
VKPQTNTATLVESQLLGEVTSPELSGSVYTVTRDGLPFVPVGCGGIHYNVTVGMPVFGWAADQAQPGVSLENPDPAANVGLSVFACVGNRAVVRSGPAAGAVGVVTGKHEQFDTFQHVLVDFPQPVIELLVPGDKVAIASVGVGLQIPELPSVTFHSLGPQLWERWAVAMVGGRLEVPVVVTLPPQLVGIGSGRVSAATSLALQLPDRQTARDVGADDLRIGDIVAVRDWDGRYATGYRRGSLLVGVIVHGASRLPGHGPSITILASARDGAIVPAHDPAANLARLLMAGTGRAL